jgi:acyl carrier protein
MNDLKLKNIEEFISSKIAGAMEINPEKIDVTVPFEAYGIDSITAVRMVGELEDLLDVELPTSLLWEYDNIQKLSQHLVSLENN